MSRRLAFLVLFAAGSWAAPPSARALGLHPCTAAIAKAVEKYVKGKYKALAKCENGRSSGKLDQSINCRPAAGAVTDPKTADKLAKLAAKVEPAIAKKCMAGDFPPNVLARPLGPACDSATDAATLAACITAPVQDPDVEPINVDTLIATVYDTNAPISDAGLRACQAAISKAVSRYLPGRLKTLRKCAGDWAALRIAACPDTTAAAAMEMQRAAMDAQIRAACSETQLASNTAPKLDFGASCSAYKLVSFIRGPANTNAMPVQDRLIHCLTDAAAGVADRTAAIALSNPERFGFTQGVAAGDATDTSAMFWTRLPNSAAGALLDISTDPTFAMGTNTLAVASDPGDDGIVKEDVGMLAANTVYYYRFTQGTAHSPVGRVKTTPVTSDTTQIVHLGWTGDSNAFNQPFTSLDPLRLLGPDAWLYVGDTIYGDDDQSDGINAMTRPEYESKYRRNRADSPLRNLMASTGTYAMWDDHEVRNDFAGAVPAVAARMAEGNVAFRRYFPLREDGVDPMKLYRSTRWGSGAEFFLIDDRQYRSAKYTCCSDGTSSGFVLTANDDSTCPGGGAGEALTPSAACQTAMDDPSRTILGAAQKQWLKDGLLNSTATFKFIMNGPPVTQLLFLPYDRWEAWKAERNEILDYIETNNIKNVIWLSTDFHTIIFSPVRVDNADTHHTPELVSGPVGENTLFRELPPTVLSLLGVVPTLIQQVSEFELDRYNTCLITIDPTASPATATFDFYDRTGLKVHSISYNAVP